MATIKQIIKTFEILAESRLTINYNNGDCNTTWRVERLGDTAFKFVMLDTPKNVWTILWENEIAQCKNDINKVMQFVYEFARAY